MSILPVKTTRSRKEIGSRHSTTTTEVARGIDLAALAQVVCRFPPIVLSSPLAPTRLPRDMWGVCCYHVSENCLQQPLYLALRPNPTFKPPL
jgi:hypothetical protein